MTVRSLYNLEFDHFRYNEDFPNMPSEQEYFQTFPGIFNFIVVKVTNYDFLFYFRQNETITVIKSLSFLLIELFSFQRLYINSLIDFQKLPLFDYN